jgi:hypothetical protein
MRRLPLDVLNEDKLDSIRCLSMGI